jgi:hypothetical protein
MTSLKSNNRIMIEGKVMTATQGSENVFEDLGFGAEETATLKVRADLMIKRRLS